MYAELLDAAFSERPAADSRATVSEALSALLHCRDRLGSSASQADATATSLANQVAYDIALIELARAAGLDCEPNTFDQPERRRAELRTELISRGIRLDNLD
jgi:hypothetical protein